MIEDHPTMDGENAIPLDGLAAGADALEAIVVFMLSHVYTYASWVRPTASITASSISTSLRDAYIAAAQASGKLRAATGQEASREPIPLATLTIEDGGRICIVQRVRSFAVATVFEAETPLGLARAHAHKIVRTLEHELPYEGRLPTPAAQPVTLMMPAYVPPTPARPEPTPKPASVEVSPAASSKEPQPHFPDRVPAPVIHEEAAPDTTDSQRQSKGPDAVPGDKLGLRRPTTPQADGNAPAAPVAALSLAHHPAPTSSDGQREPNASDGPPETRAIRILAYIEGTSIEPHITFMRLALRSGLGLAQLRDLRRLSAEQLRLLETAAEEMLGLERGKLAEKIRASVPVIPLPVRGAP